MHGLLCKPLNCKRNNYSKSNKHRLIIQSKLGNYYKAQETNVSRARCKANRCFTFVDAIHIRHS